MNWDQSKCAICSAPTIIYSGSSSRSIRIDHGQLGILNAPLCKKCFAWTYEGDWDSDDLKTGYKSVLHGRLIDWPQVCIEAHLIICGGVKIPGAITDNHKSCTKCNFPYPYESGPAICKSCQVWEYVS